MVKSFTGSFVSNMNEILRVIKKNIEPDQSIILQPLIFAKDTLNKIS